MKVKDIMDYFGPRLNCHTKLHYVDQEPVFETDGFSRPDPDEPIWEAYVIDIGIYTDEKSEIPYLDLTLEA